MPDPVALTLRVVGEAIADAIQGAAGLHTGPGTGTYPLSHAVYDVAKAAMAIADALNKIADKMPDPHQSLEMPYDT